METVVRIKKLLSPPIRKLTSCMSGVKDRKLLPKSRNSRVGGGGNRLGKTPLLRTAHPKDPSVIRSYQADLEKQRKLREAMNAQKNAERAAMRAHYRRKYQLSENPKDTNHLRSVGGKVSLPLELLKMINPETKNKDDSFNLLSAFQGLGFGTVMLTGRNYFSKWGLL